MIPRMTLNERPSVARLKLAAVKETNWAGEQHVVALLDRTVEERLARPRCLDHSRFVLEDRLEDPQSFAGRDDSLGDHLADDRAVHSRLERCDGRDGARVLVAVRDVKEEIPRGHDSEPSGLARSITAPTRGSPGGRSAREA